MRADWKNALEQEMKRQGRNAKELSLAAGLGETYVRDALRRDRGKFENLVKVAKALGKPERWLLGKPAALVSSFDPDQPDPPETDIRMVEGTEGRDIGPVPTDAIIEADLRIGLGGGGMSHVGDLVAPDGRSYGAEGVRDWWRLPEHVVRGRFRVPAQRIRCFEAVGDSMDPTVRDGDIVFVDVGHTTPSPPGVYALADVFGGVILKRLEISSGRSDEITIRIISDNPKHMPEEQPINDVAIRGRYLGRLTTS